MISTSGTQRQPAGQDQGDAHLCQRHRGGHPPAQGVRGCVESLFVSRPPKRLERAIELFRHLVLALSLAQQQPLVLISAFADALLPLLSRLALLSSPHLTSSSTRLFPLEQTSPLASPSSSRSTLSSTSRPRAGRAPPATSTRRSSRRRSRSSTRRPSRTSRSLSVRRRPSLSLRAKLSMSVSLTLSVRAGGPPGQVKAICGPKKVRCSSLVPPRLLCACAHSLPSLAVDEGPGRAHRHARRDAVQEGAGALTPFRLCAFFAVVPLDAPFSPSRSSHSLLPPRTPSSCMHEAHEASLSTRPSSTLGIDKIRAHSSPTCSSSHLATRPSHSGHFH